MNFSIECLVFCFDMSPLVSLKHLTSLEHGFEQVRNTMFRKSNDAFLEYVRNNNLNCGGRNENQTIESYVWWNYEIEKRVIYFKLIVINVLFYYNNNGSSKQNIFEYIWPINYCILFVVVPFVFMNLLSNSYNNK